MKAHFFQLFFIFRALVIVNRRFPWKPVFTFSASYSSLYEPIHVYSYVRKYIWPTNEWIWVRSLGFFSTEHILISIIRKPVFCVFNRKTKAPILYLNDQQESLCFYISAGIIKQSMGVRNRVGIEVSYRPARAGIFKQSMGARNRVGIGLLYRATHAGGIDFLASIPGLHKSLKIRAQGCAYKCIPSNYH